MPSNAGTSPGFGERRAVGWGGGDILSGRPATAPMLDSFLGRAPRLGREAFVAPTAAVVGDVTLGDGASVWFGASMRGDVHWIEVGPGSNVQDLSLIHI